MKIRNPKLGADIKTMYESNTILFPKDSEKEFDEEVGRWLKKQYGFLIDLGEPSHDPDYIPIVLPDSVEEQVSWLVKHFPIIGKLISKFKTTPK